MASGARARSTWRAVRQVLKLACACARDAITRPKLEKETATTTPATHESAGARTRNDEARAGGRRKGARSPPPRAHVQQPARAEQPPHSRYHTTTATPLRLRRARNTNMYEIIATACACATEPRRRCADLRGARARAGARTGVAGARLLLQDSVISSWRAGPTRRGPRARPVAAQLVPRRVPEEASAGP